MRDLIDLEEEGWQILSMEGHGGKKFYGSLLHDDAIMLFPGRPIIDGKQCIFKKCTKNRALFH